MVRSTFFGFATAWSAISASQKALDVTGQNIGNVHTRGYTRQRLDLYSEISGGYANQYAFTPDNSVGGGVRMGGISQIRDPFLDVRFRNEAAKIGAEDAKLTVLKNLESIFDEVSQDGLGSQINDFIKQLQALSKETGNAEFDGIVKASAEVLTKLFNQYSTQIDTVKDQQLYDLDKVAIANVNNMLKNIANINKSIKSDQLHGNPALELLDQRNLMLDDLSKYLKIDVTYTPTEVAPGLIIDEMRIDFVGANGKIPLVDDSDYATLTFNENTDGTVNVSLQPSKVTITDNLKEVNNLIQGISSGNTQIDTVNATLEPAAKQALIDAVTADLTLTPAEKAKQIAAINARPALTPAEKADKIATINAGQQASIAKLQEFFPTPSIINATANGTNGFNLTIDLGGAGAAINLINGTTVSSFTFNEVDGKAALGGVDITAAFATGFKAAIDKTMGTGADNITTEFKEGVFKGILDMLNSKGEFDTPPSTIRGIGYYNSMIDTMAEQFAFVFNEANQALNPDYVGLDTTTATVIQDSLKQLSEINTKIGSASAADKPALATERDRLISVLQKRLGTGAQTPIAADGTVQVTVDGVDLLSTDDTQGKINRILAEIQAFNTEITGTPPPSAADIALKKQAQQDRLRDLQKFMPGAVGYANTTNPDQLDVKLKDPALTLIDATTSTVASIQYDPKTKTANHTLGGGSPTTISGKVIGERTYSNVEFNATTGKMTATLPNGTTEDLTDDVIPTDPIKNPKYLSRPLFGSSTKISGDTATTVNDLLTALQTANTAATAAGATANEIAKAKADQTKLLKELQKYVPDAIGVPSGNMTDIKLNIPNGSGTQTIDLLTGTTAPATLTFNATDQKMEVAIGANTHDLTKKVQEKITAANIKISQGWTALEYGITTSKIKLPGDNSGAHDNILFMISLFEQKIDFKTNNGTALFKGTFQECFSQTGNVLALDINSTEKIFKNYASVLSGVSDQRNSISAVSLDEEGVNIMKYQKSFNAASRLMTTLDEALDTIINQMGRVGR